MTIINYHIKKDLNANNYHIKKDLNVNNDHTRKDLNVNRRYINSTRDNPLPLVMFVYYTLHLLACQLSYRGRLRALLPLYV